MSTADKYLFDEYVDPPLRLPQKVRDDPAMQTDRLLEMRVLGEFREMPGLCLTVAQAARLWGIDDERCRQMLQHLATCGLLRQLPDGRYMAAES